MNKEQAKNIATGIAAGIAAVDFLVEIAEALRLDPAITNIDGMLARIEALIATEKRYDEGLQSKLGDPRDQ